MDFKYFLLAYSFRTDNDTFETMLIYLAVIIPDKFERNKATKNPPTPKQANKY